MSGTDDIDMDEFGEITDFIQEASGGTAELITGYGTDPSLGDNVSVTIIATGFNSKQETGFETPLIKEIKIVNLDEKTPEPVNKTIVINEVNTDEAFVYTKQEIDTPVSENIPTQIEEEIVSRFETNINSQENNKAIEFTFNNIDEKNVNFLDETKAMKIVNQETISREEQIKLAQDRIRKLKDITLRMKSPEGLAALEKQTAFERKNIILENKMPSLESNVSRYTLFEDENKKIEIRPNNSFLHDNVD
jgi:cell division protein FtsZ